MKYLLIIIYSTLTMASGDHSAGNQKVELKKWSAVTAFDEHDGFKLTDKAKKILGVEFTSIQGSGPWKIPKTALLEIKQSSGVFRKWDNWITMVLVTVVEEGSDYYQIKSVDLQDSDQIATAGVQFLRMTEADLNSDTVDACSH